MLCLRKSCDSGLKDRDSYMAETDPDSLQRADWFIQPLVAPTQPRAWQRQGLKMWAQKHNRLSDYEKKVQVLERLVVLSDGREKAEMLEKLAGAYEEEGRAMLFDPTLERIKETVPKEEANFRIALAKAKKYLRAGMVTEAASTLDEIKPAGLTQQQLRKLEALALELEGRAK